MGVLFPSEDVNRAPVLQRDGNRIRWTVDGRKLKSKDREAVSPSFEIRLGRKEVNFKMVIRPKQVHDLRGGGSFKKAKGKGYVELRCLEQVHPAEDPTVTYRITVDSGLDVGESRGPVVHNFSDRAIGGSSEAEEEWDFSKHVNTETNTFAVVLDILAGGVAA